MEPAPEYLDDGSSFKAIDPKAINPDALANFAIYERYPWSQGKFRFRCLLMDTGSLERARLKELIGRWETVYLHKKEMGVYTDYVRENLEFILGNEQISPESKAETLVPLFTEVVAGAFTTHFSGRTEIDRMIGNVQTLIKRAVTFLSSIESLKGVARLVGHDYETHTHSIKVGWLMAVFINANQDLFENQGAGRIRALALDGAVAGFLHDLGKVKVPKSIIQKPGRLDNMEYTVMQCHAPYAAAMLFDSPLSRPVLQAVLYHHENEDGSGYPCNLEGDQIPLMAKICHIVDVFDALTSERPYKKAKTPFEALTLMAGENPYLDTLRQFEAEMADCAKPPVAVLVRDSYPEKLKRLREREILEAEADKRVEARIKLRDKGMAHCFDKGLLRRFILTLNRSESFDLSGLL